MPLIYKLYDELDCYIGSTTETLKTRLSKHINNRNCKSRIILDRKKFTMELIEEVETNDRFKREQYWIDELSTLSQHNCYWKNVEEKKDKYDKEFRENHKEYYIEKAKQHYEKNKEKLHEKFSCECGGKYTYKHKLTHLKTKKHLEYIDAER